MANPDSQRLLLIGFLVKLGVMATIAAVLVRSVAFKRVLYAPIRTRRQRWGLVLFFLIPFGGDVVMRLLSPGFGVADLTLPGAVLTGLIAGQLPGAVGGALIALPAAIVAHQWLGLGLAALAGWAGGLCRRAAPTAEEIWGFSPFIDLELWRWLQNRLDRPLRDWQALMFAVLAALTLITWDVARWAPGQVYFAPWAKGWGLLVAILGTVLSVAIPIKIWNNTRIEMKLEEQQRLLIQARLDALTSQINPHFLFNTLNSVASLVRFDPDTARLLIVKLSNILRRLLKKHEHYAPLADELAFIDDYLDIEVVRFGPERLRFVKDIDPAVLHDPVPSMLLQPFIENSIRHGLAPGIEGGTITLRARRPAAGSARAGKRPVRLLIEIGDDGVGMPPERLAEARRALAAGRGGIGISNARERLRVLYGEAAVLEIGSSVGHGTWVKIEFPVVAAAELPAWTEPAAERAVSS
jgi:two-component system LytT family sensor kinase